ncbi:Phosphoribosylaminoimidazole carboxylase [Taphrina deformans PYCC 5710]|uniref:Phosphoribosylaminoimidazole carboxylase n=1 Tax=Taphrina deformans (strain PYCC 5710 / ATCC 11124 / CBS 356.35 / IMI 108563 / JCM 9778 / NBRC 8474) TaxID=1097556 RepID=R4X882_TAPDE|nr:Phosphoribosylaminoimidazole carboxylase [Taphrina deformans PYCC 5710]|eukprot:CCG81472.1 Phosphoribosylaminoimidazole carboxylase [Taphrina deformans PYCC 5710]
MKQKIGVLGGGQLGRMLQQPAARLGIDLLFLDPDENSPAKQICASSKHVTGKFTDETAVKELADQCDILTIEIEHVNTDVLKQIKKEGKVLICPDPDDIALIKDKFQQKERLKKILGERAVAEQRAVASDSTSVKQLGEQMGFPFLLKSRTDAYDGRGNYVVQSPDFIEEALQVLKDRPLYGERMVEFQRELAVMVLRTRDGLVYSYPCVETEHEDNICKTVYAPAKISLDQAHEARQLAETAIRETFTGAGIFGVELFHLKDGSIMLNEIAPRPHNSGHYTIEACTISQYEAHLRAILGRKLPPQPTRQNRPAIMYNLLGAEDPTYIDMLCERADSIAGATIHLYGKAESRPKRKMGHITITGSTMAECKHSLRQLIGEASESPVKVLVCMGSTSDGPSMQACCDTLKEFGVGYHKEVISAHRQPAKLREWATTAHERGYQVVIAAAGGAAHLPGMIAAQTSLPVIGVPINATSLDGLDSLLSIVQMPRGVPVATVAIGNSTNAALLAIRILGIADDTKLRQIEEKMERNRNDVDTANESFREVYTDTDAFQLQSQSSSKKKGLLGSLKENLTT